MKKIINGKEYDTNTAKCVADWENGYGHNDFISVEEHLYRKKTGEFFLHGEGGAMTEDAKHCFNGYCYGEKIIPFSVGEAKEWAENHLDGDTYEDIFGSVEE